LSLLVPLLLLAACGKRGDPLPPLRPTPQPVAGLKLSQRGDQMELGLVAPRVGTDGTRLRLLEVEILRADGLPDWEFKSIAKRFKLLTVAPGEAILENEPLPRPGTTVRIVARAIAKGHASIDTLPAVLEVQKPLTPPTGLVATLKPTGVELRWKGESVLFGGFWPYRKPEKGTFGSPVTPGPVAGPPFLDTSAPVGETVCYVVRSVATVSPIVESASSEEACVGVKDVSAPATPAALTAVVEPSGSVALSWSPGTETDLAHYRVYRSLDRSAAPERIAELPPGETSYRDSGLPSGSAPRYTVSAVDAVGNESAPSTPAAVRIP
jgi:hypothetical protein